MYVEKMPRMPSNIPAEDGIANGQPNVSIERPPTGLYNIWVGRNGPVTQTSRRSEAYQAQLEAREEREH